jgi:hypothetical protein
MQLSYTLASSILTSRQKIWIPMHNNFCAIVHAIHNLPQQTIITSIKSLVLVHPTINLLGRSWTPKIAVFGA